MLVLTRLFGAFDHPSPRMMFLWGALKYDWLDRQDLDRFRVAHVC
jgi:hypothetical protein